MSKKDNSQIEYVEINYETYFKISNIDQLRPFFMSIVSDSNHWMFIGSNGGLSAGRKNSEYSFFPYYTDDKIIESAETTGSKTIFQVKVGNNVKIWEPFSLRDKNKFKIQQNLYKNVYGNKVRFEEINEDLGLTFQYQWASSNLYGFVRQSSITNNTSVSKHISFIDGFQNIVPYSVGSMLQNQRSNLVDAYKRNELIRNSGLGIFALSATLVDKAEPSEALKANIAWSLGLDQPTHLLSSLQLDKFRNGDSVEQEEDIKAERGAYFVNKTIELGQNASENWSIVANVNQDISNVIAISELIQNDDQLLSKVETDIEDGTQRLISLNGAADGLQFTKDKLKDTRHFANSLFNIMRGGIFDDNYTIEKRDFSAYLKNANKVVFESNKALIDGLPTKFTLFELQEKCAQTNNSDLIRLGFEYLPLKFSRRHGDPSRPWNQFSINTTNESDGSKILDYEGNWRDIFQNWEALAHSYPEFIEGMIFKFLNASTFDGYNPYRITKNGIDWEKIEADDPWSYIGYWGDHQIIYLLKFLEFVQNHKPGTLEEYFNQSVFVYANVPYRIKEYKDTLKNPKDTIDFDHSLDSAIDKRRLELGADGALLLDQKGDIYHVNFIEKILATVLAKVSNFIPEGGIWMNTQRPEWNDANNALVGNGVSMVTLFYLRRFLIFFNNLIKDSNTSEVSVSQELSVFFKGIVQTLQDNKQLLAAPINDSNRKTILDGLGQAGSNYRSAIYQNSFKNEFDKLSINELKDFCDLMTKYLDHTIASNKRSDNMYHSYNLMTVESDQEVSIAYLSEMLEGQVAALSSGYLSPDESLLLLDGLKASKLFRDDQYSYILYPNKDLAGFTEKNTIPKASIEKSELLTRLLKDKNRDIVIQDVKGGYHFNGNFKNAKDLENALLNLSETDYSPLVKSDQKLLLKTFEEVFNHKAFTGRSGTFYGYEGLGSIYWHMVSKLLLAVQECCLKAIEEQASDEIIGRLLEHYYEINEGIGVHKSPKLYGAFPTDPYSHTPFGKGAQQPGMTGQVKEDVIARFGELGVFTQDGKLQFNPCMLKKDEFLKSKELFNYKDIDSNDKQIEIESGSLAFTYCQVPIVYTISDTNSLEVVFSDGKTQMIDTLSLDKDLSKHLFERSGKIAQIKAKISGTILK